MSETFSVRHLANMMSNNRIEPDVAIGCLLLEVGEVGTNLLMASLIREFKYDQMNSMSSG